MKNLFLFLFCVTIHFSLRAQTVYAAGRCISDTITLNRIADSDGKPAYQGSGTVGGSPGVAVYIYWLASDQLWVLDFDGQPYFTSSCNNAMPPATSIVACPWSAVTGTDCTGSAPLYISGPGTLPVNLIGFVASKTEGGVRLTWKTAAETNNKGFEVQRSTDRSSWTNIGFVKGAVNSSVEKNYSFHDNFPFSGKNYYRLNQIDLDNLQIHSLVASIVAGSSAGYHLNTNNTNSGVYQLIILSPAPLGISVLDMGGRKLIQKNAGQGVHQLDISRQAPGIYLLQLRKNNEVITEKLVKN